MARTRRRSILLDALRGAVAGGVAVWLMDQVTTGLLEQQRQQVTEREEAARPNGKSALENLLDRLERDYGLELDQEGRSAALQAIHYGLGVVPGALYAVLRRRLPLLGSARGVAYGVLLFAINDEYLNTRLALAGPFDAYPLETHWRGLVGHIVLGVATDTGIEVLGG
ncbi:MAG: DUF1440 domain-containing protein [Chloroflexota bacterium]|nr:DUF1440 domain-containing protein [Chloroflexota bacterium]